MSSEAENSDDLGNIRGWARQGLHPEVSGSTYEPRRFVLWCWTPPCLPARLQSVEAGNWACISCFHSYQAFMLPDTSLGHAQAGSAAGGHWVSGHSLAGIKRTCVQHGSSQSCHLKVEGEARCNVSSKLRRVFCCCWSLGYPPTFLFPMVSAWASGLPPGKTLLPNRKAQGNTHPSCTGQTKANEVIIIHKPNR